MKRKKVKARRPRSTRKHAPLAAPPGMKLDLGCGQSPKEGFEGVDISPTAGAKHVLDLWKFPWPFADNSVTEIHCSHHVEHIPAREIEERDLNATVVCEREGCGRTLEQWNAGGVQIGCLGVHNRHKWSFVGQDMLFAFFDECYRILQPDAWINVIVPAVQSVRAFQDPTHRRFIPAELLLYLAEPFRKINKLDHYRVKCNFEIPPTGPEAVIPEEIMGYTREAQVREMLHKWNVVQDWSVRLKALKPDSIAP